MARNFARFQISTALPPVPANRCAGGRNLSGEKQCRKSISARVCVRSSARTRPAGTRPTSQLLACCRGSMSVFGGCFHRSRYHLCAVRAPTPNKSTATRDFSHMPTRIDRIPCVFVELVSQASAESCTMCSLEMACWCLQGRGGSIAKRKAGRSVRRPQFKGTGGVEMAESRSRLAVPRRPAMTSIGVVAAKVGPSAAFDLDGCGLQTRTSGSLSIAAPTIGATSLGPSASMKTKARYQHY